MTRLTGNLEEQNQHTPQTSHLKHLQSFKENNFVQCNLNSEQDGQHEKLFSKAVLLDFT